ncbi:MAG: hypothetical protein U5L75_02905 [Candidatus Campbellbacteria bacterium]|nr:hypothetical protein [Candidatus Campbellbacteria bacterium]
MHYSRNILIMVIIATIIGASAYTFVFLGVRNTSEKTREIKEQMSEELGKQERSASIQALYERTDEEREELMSRIISEENLVRFFEELESIGSDAGVSMEIASINEHVSLEPVVSTDEEGKESKPEEHPASDDLEWLQMDISAEGSWQSVYKFLSFVELMPYVIELSNVHLKLSESARQEAAPSPEGEGEIEPPPLVGQTWELTLTAKVLRVKE